MKFLINLEIKNLLFTVLREYTNHNTVSEVPKLDYTK